jgi:hypothetical protein
MLYLYGSVCISNSLMVSIDHKLPRLLEHSVSIEVLLAQHCICGMGEIITSAQSRNKHSLWMNPEEVVIARQLNRV